MVERIKYKMRRLQLHEDDPGLLDRLEELASHLALTKNHIAPILGVSRSTFYEFLAGSQKARDAFSRGRARGRLSHAQLLDMHAQTSPQTAVFLAKQKRYLGMSDNPTVDKAVADQANAEVKALRSRDELLARAKELLRKAPKEIDGEAEDITPKTPPKPSSKRPNHDTKGRSIARRK